MKARVLVVAAVVLVATVGAAGPAAAETIVGSPELTLTAQDNRVEPGERTAVTIAVTNQGKLRTGGGPGALEQQTKTARGVTVDVLDEQIDAPIEVTSGAVALGSLPDGGVGTATVRLETAESLAPGEYRIPVEVSYSHTSVVNYEEARVAPGYKDVDYSDSSRTYTKYVTLVVDEQAQFEVESASNAVVAGDADSLEFTIRNVGSETARKASVSLAAGTGDLYFGEPTDPRQSRTVYVESLGPGESRQLEVTVGATSSISPGEYPVAVDVAYETPDGVASTSKTLSAGVRVERERSFDIRAVTTESFRVDESAATVEATIVNTGDTPANNVVVRTNGPGVLQATSPESAVGDLAPGESAETSFTFAVPSDAEPGSLSLSFAVEYENARDELRSLDEPIRRAVTLDAERDAFEVVGVDTAVTSGGEATLAVDVRYQGDEPVSNANAKLFVNDPLSSADDGAFLGSFEPGETKTATFSVSAAGTAMGKAYPGSVEIRYDDADGDSALAEGLQFGVPVDENSGGLPIGYIAAGAGVFVLSGGVFVWQRRRRE